MYTVTDGGYDDQQFSNGGDVQQGEDVVPILDEDDIATQTAPHTLPDQPPFPGGPLDISLLSSYASHVALRLWYNSNNVSVFLIVLNYYMQYLKNIISTYAVVCYFFFQLLFG